MKRHRVGVARTHRVGKAVLVKRKRRAEARAWVQAVDRSRRLFKEIQSTRNPRKLAALKREFLEVEAELHIPPEQSRLNRSNT